MGVRLVLYAMSSPLFPLSYGEQGTRRVNMTSSIPLPFSYFSYFFLDKPAGPVPLTTCKA